MQLEIGLANQVLSRETEILCHGVVCNNEAALRILNEQIVGHAIDHGTKEKSLGVPIAPGRWGSKSFCLKAIV